MRKVTRIKVAVVTVAAAALAGVGLLANGAEAAPTYPVVTNYAAAALTAVDYQQSPPGANVPGCRTDAQHPYPIVLVHGTFEDQHDNWLAAAPWLANRGFCVYSFNYGGSGPFQATGEITRSAEQLNTEINHVLQTTGASQVDILGHSQGGMMPREYIKLHGGAKIHTYVALAPSNYGTTTDGIVQLGRLLPGESELINGVLGIACTACVEQEIGSPFLTQLNAGSDTVSGVKYVVIETTGDEVVTPYTNAFLHSTGPDVRNITIQDICRQDASDHLQIAYDTNALQIAAKAFAETPLPDITNGVTCSVQLPLGV